MEEEYWGRRIRAFRKLKGYTQRELAEKIHVSVSVLGEIERGNRLPTRKILMDIARVLDIELEEIVTYKKN
ncbi:MAG: XRE family transcriptional regulator [Caldibacillus debilis]|jgi:transcriptional regulator with XRE-family HTH domain|uniref:XRE family transcriptional regulator n=2 Tax=Caldibacillus debilis TaxID=301148 RepID=A0A150LCJ0_9BACI|nr:helix-turn-helix transcriptional regulator [Caldibacillus debilis]MBO2481530.1 XRE family transcriptional regulator [Bacillaceae bacterium]KYD10061.1 hypothetical protein B4135_3637 [Caldibacillus debilis]MBY6271495.1 XRE family transcriptional regulator [Bacillaceae bacterium]OUM86495.1 MAG: transcriptional regulator [Caldibacillus debilis]REJ19148.1 MAG: XRE family transcriptional regulator [Caldibacillus debilis]